MLDLLPYPFSETTKISEEVSLMAIIPTTSSASSASLIPRTPEAFLPIGLVFSSSNLMALPLLTASITWLSPVVSFASRSSSPSLIVMALIPLVLGLEYCSSGVFLTCPFLVAMITYLLFTYSSSLRSCVQINAITLSSGSMLIKFWIARPFDVLLPSGISKTRIQKHFPFCVKNNIYW